MSTSKFRKKIDNRQLSLFDLFSQSSSPCAGELDVRSSLKAALTRAIKESPLSRHEIAARMSDLTGHAISKFMLDAYTAESKEFHRMPAELLPAFCVATGSLEPLELLCRKAGAFCVPGPDALRAELKRIEEQIARLQAERRRRQILLQKLEEEA
jgi:hypothetical protein